MTTKEILPLPESTYQLLLDAARAWPDGVATQWIPDPADYTRCLARTDAGPDGRPLTVAYLDGVIAGQPSGHLAGADLPKAGDLAAFVHTGGTTGAPKVAAQTHANQLACGRGIAECSGLAPGEATLGGL